MTHLRNALIIALLAFACLFAYKLCLLADRATEAVDSVRVMAAQAQRVTVQAGANSNAVLLQLGLAADQWRRASERQEAYSNAIQRGLGELGDAVSGTRHLLKTTEFQVAANGEEARKALANLSLVGQDAAGVLRRTDSVVAALGDSVPSVRESAAQVAVASTQLAAAAGHANNTTAEAEEAMGYVRDSLKPTKAGFWGNVLRLILGKAIPQTTRTVGK